MALPVKRPTACTFGGDQLQHLYVTTRVESGGRVGTLGGKWVECLGTAGQCRLLFARVAC